MSDDGDDYDEAADRVKGQVPDRYESQTQIREWIEDNIDWGHDPGDATDTLNDEIADRIADGRGGATDDQISGPRPGDGNRIVYDADTGVWRDADTGSFVSPPDEEG